MRRCYSSQPSAQRQLLRPTTMQVDQSGKEKCGTQTNGGTSNGPLDKWGGSSVYDARLDLVCVVVTFQLRYRMVDFLRSPRRAAATVNSCQNKYEKKEAFEAVSSFAVTCRVRCARGAARRRRGVLSRYPSTAEDASAGVRARAYACAPGVTKWAEIRCSDTKRYGI
jgi:hypothetical protein